MANLTTKSKSANLNVSPWVDQSPITHVAGESYTHSLTWLGATTVTIGATGVAIYDYEGTNVVGTLMPAGSHSATGNVATFKPLVLASVGYNNSFLIMTMTCTVDGNVEIRKLEIVIRTAARKL